MSELRNRPKSARLARFGLSFGLFALLPSEIGYQDLGALLGELQLKHGSSAGQIAHAVLQPVPAPGQAANTTALLPDKTAVQTRAAGPAKGLIQVG